ncbi:conserved protein, unknown function [Hepatocystis sp. ex Piliocolobus tephrosceles]|nr:conserved protein, unknown function [Hepatocystis sp. ex Piliocolobus tephrosceles]
MNKYLILNCHRYKHLMRIKRFKCIFNNKLSDKNLRWRTTNESYCEYILTKEEEKELKNIHNSIISNNKIHVDKQIINESIKKYKTNNTVSTYYTKLNNNLNIIKYNESILAYSYINFINNIKKKIKTIPIINYFYNNIISKYVINIQKFISPIYERINNEDLFIQFELDKTDVRAIMYFLCIHVWIYCAKLNSLNNTYMKVLLWEKIWDYYRALLIKYKVSEFNFNTYLINMQEYSLGFCIGLDDCMNKEIFAGHIYYTLFNHIYNENEKYKNSNVLINLTVYCLRMYNFVCNLSPENFMQATFTWPNLKENFV